MEKRQNEPSELSGLGFGRGLLRAWESCRRAYREFLRTPAIVIGVFLLFAAVTYWLDRAWTAPASGASPSLASVFFTDSESTRDFLATITSSMITVTSITFSLLLIAVQQAAGALTSVVLDQFLRREANRFFFGFFVGVSLYAMLTLATVSPSFNPVLGAASALLLTMAALFMLIFLIYTTIDQMRDVTIIEAIHDHVLAAREKQMDLLEKTRRVARLDRGSEIVRAKKSGFLVAIDIAALERAAAEAGDDAEVVLLPAIGDYIAFSDAIARIGAAPASGVSGLADTVIEALCLEEERDLERDPAFGLMQLSTIAWTSISTSKQNPHPGLLVCYSLKDILARWSEDPRFALETGESTGPEPRVVYNDRVAEQVMDTLESLGVVASESMQHQVLAELFATLASLFDRLPPPLRDRAEDILMRALSGLGDHIPTREVESALSEAAAVLTKAERINSASSIRAAKEQLAKSAGKLNSRATRAPAA